MVKILFVDDNRPTVKVVKNKLTDLGFAVLPAYGGLEAVTLYSKEKKKPDIIFMDHLMPIMDGETALVEIKKINPNAIVIMMVTGVVIDEVMFNLQVLSLKEKGASGLLVKPLTISSIEKKVAEFF